MILVKSNEAFSEVFVFGSHVATFELNIRVSMYHVNRPIIDVHGYCVSDWIWALALQGEAEEPACWTHVNVFFFQHAALVLSVDCLCVCPFYESRLTIQVLRQLRLGSWDYDGRWLGSWNYDGLRNWFYDRLRLWDLRFGVLSRNVIPRIRLQALIMCKM